MIEIHALCKSFKGQVVLDHVDLTVPEGKIMVIIGPTGTGKSVLLKQIMGLLKPDSGEIIFNGKDLVTMSELELMDIRKNFGVCFQDAALFDSMNVGENVGFPFAMHTDLKKEQIEKEVASLLREVGLSGIEAKMPSQLSGGMRKRVGLARALALKPKVILFDEPTTGLDPVMTTAIHTLIRQVQQKSHATCLVISHDIHGAFDFADYMAMLFQGHIVYQGTSGDFKTCEDPLVKQFIQGTIEGPINPIQ